MKNTIISQQRTKFASNRQSIEMAIGLSTLEYNELQFESGLRFLQERFPDKTKYAMYYVLYSRSKAFWKWWTAELAIWEADLLAYSDTHQVRISQPFYMADWNHPRTQKRFESSFHNHFLKHFQFSNNLKINKNE